MVEPTQDKSGAWDVPIQNYVKECKLVVILYSLTRDEIEKEIQIDYGKYEDRKFLGRLTYWAVTNSRTIETMSYQDWKDSK
jgi:hypothetical protein